MEKKTPLYNHHLQAGAKMVDFSGWEMPLHYGSQLDEHHYVRREAGVFDVSHMTIVDLYGPDVHAYLRYLLANDVAKLDQQNKVLYSCMLNPKGAILDDLMVYRLDENAYRLVVNCATSQKDLNWLQSHSSEYAVEIVEQDELAILAVQGPKALQLAVCAISEERGSGVSELQPFYLVQRGKWVIARTGYTGEDGLEIMLPVEEVGVLWERLLRLGVHPCGLGARDTLRLEAGLSLYGSDLDETVTPLQSRLGWTVAWEPESRDFIGRQALEQQKTKGVQTTLVGLVLLERGVLRNHQKVIVKEREIGVITSGGFSPTLQCGIALARVPMGTSGVCHVEVRGKRLLAQVISPPFVKGGEANFIFQNNDQVNEKIK